MQPSKLRTREDIRRFRDNLAGRRDIEEQQRTRRWLTIPRAVLLLLLCVTVLQYYFVVVNVVILSLPRLVFVAPEAPQSGRSLLAPRN